MVLVSSVEMVLICFSKRTAECTLKIMHACTDISNFLQLWNLLKFDNNSLGSILTFCFIILFGDGVTV